MKNRSYPENLFLRDKFSQGEITQLAKQLGIHRNALSQALLGYRRLTPILKKEIIQFLINKQAEKQLLDDILNSAII